MKFGFFCIMICIGTISCTKQNENSNEPSLVLRIKFDSTQQRLNNIGQPAEIPAGHAAQNPSFNTISVHYVELAPNASTALGGGAVLYRAPETENGGEKAIDFDKSIFTSNNEVFFAAPLKSIPAGEYEWFRVSLAYQNYDVQYHLDTTIADITINEDFKGTIASFIGFNTFIHSYMIRNQQIQVEGDKKQGYWGFETTIHSETYTATGQSPEGATTVVNPIFNTSPIPAGSCVVTAAFLPGKLTVTGNEKENIIVEVSLSVNKSFEWQEIVNNGKWDPLKGEPVVDMGIRGMKPTIQ
ncbi:MAG: hypothetical protein JST63_13530 [Bacteroidetes bacterium]|nr:hypothetical protein [Bacteroidota bacterium]